MTEEDDFGVKDGEITVTLEEEEEEKTGDLINTRERPDSEEPEMSEPTRRHHCSHCGKSFNQLGDLKNMREYIQERSLHQCSQCGQCFTWLQNLKTTSNTTHRRETLPMLSV
ncbi:zinc finger protein 771-like [Coregonus clupeaformis]|uniref:zinc finger protein 771-like n=1 Tax=Coregonus clupeaformis TaxID=59861 RepID=UPI001E1C9CAA|nr:zinc finger protein 771-like [Coregonus clupeaformis]